jgi:hypothetical protein
MVYLYIKSKIRKMSNIFLVFYVFLAPKYLIITADEFYHAILPLAKWKHRKGLPTKVEKLSTIGSTPDDIYNYIGSYFGKTSPPPEYVLLVGDLDFMPAYPYGGDLGPPCDHKYTLHEGNDHLADILIARLPANTAEECSIMVDKLLEYEYSPPMSVPLSYKRALNLHGGSWAPLANNVNTRLRELGFIYIDSLSLGARDTTIVNRIDDGRGIVVYLGHGSVIGWNTTGFDRNDALSLTNRSILCPIVISPVACLNAQFKSSCLGEAFLNQVNGAVGFWGAITMSYFEEQGDTCAIGFFYGLKQGIYNFQKLCNWAKLYMCQYFDPNTDGLCKKVMYVLTTLGDPELPIWTDIPKPFVVTHDTILYSGITTDFTITVKDTSNNPIDSAYVCCMCKFDSTIYETGYTSTNGDITFSVTPNIDFDTMFVTVTAWNYLPYKSFAIVKIFGVEEEQRIFDIVVNQSVGRHSFIIEYEILSEVSVDIKIYDNVGRVVKSLIEGRLSPGKYNVRWDGKDIYNKEVHLGIYFCRFSTSSLTKTIKLVKI